MSSVRSILGRKSYRQLARDFDDNPGQRAAYESKGNCVILAGPGSGKTKTLTVKLARMAAEDVRAPRGIACLTYNLECAGELRRRLGELGMEGARNFYVGTVHSFCLRHVLMSYSRISDAPLPAGASVASSADTDKIFSGSVKHVISADERPERFHTRCSTYRRNFPDRSSAAFRETDPQTAELVLDYEGRLRAAGKIDFDMMVLEGLRLIEKHAWVRRAIAAKFPILAVDEYQDLGLPLHRIVLSLCFKAGIRLLAVGDPDQSIYGFAGSQPNLLVQLAERPDVESIRLKFNYRSGSTIVGMSEVALGETRGYQAKSQHKDTIDFHGDDGGIEAQASVICEKIIPEVRRLRPNIKLGQIAILYVDKYDAEVIATRMTTAGLPFVRIDAGGPYPRTPLTRWLEAAAAWCAGGWKRKRPRLSSLIQEWLTFHRPLLLNARDQRACESEIAGFLFGHRKPESLLCDWLETLVAETSLGRALHYPMALEDECGNFERLQTICKEGFPLHVVTLAKFAREEGVTDRIKLVTLHSAKGLEFDVVVMMGMDQGRMPKYSADTGEALREQRRLFYVGLTRARRAVHMTFSGWYKGPNGRIWQKGPSEFMVEVYQQMQSSS